MGDGGLECPLVNTSLAAATAAAKPDWLLRCVYRRPGVNRVDHCRHCWQTSGSLLDDIVDFPLNAVVRGDLGFMLRS